MLHTLVRLLLCSNVIHSNHIDTYMYITLQYSVFITNVSFFLFLSLLPLVVFQGYMPVLVITIPTALVRVVGLHLLWL